MVEILKFIYVTEFSGAFRTYQTQFSRKLHVAPPQSVTGSDSNHIPSHIAILASFTKLSGASVGCAV